MTLRVLLADDQALIRATFRTLIDSCDDIEVVAEAADGEEALALTRTHRPDLALMDLGMPGTDGLAATTRICADPGLAATRVLIRTTSETGECVARALCAGASGFLGKDVGVDELLGALRTVAAGDALLSPSATRAVVTRFLATPDPDGHLAPPESIAALTARERDVLALVAEGKSNDEIAEALFGTPLTVRDDVRSTLTKLAARDRAQLVVIAYQSGLVRPAPPLC
ncbi:response regulator [Streptomyces sp. NPDC055060]